MERISVASEEKQRKAEKISQTIAKRSDCHFEKMTWATFRSRPTWQKCPCDSRAFLFARLFVLGELALCKSPRRAFVFWCSGAMSKHKRYSLSKSNRKSDIVGLNLSSNRLVGSTYRLVAIQRRRPHFYEVKYSALLYFTWKYCRKRKIERILRRELPWVKLCQN